MTDFELPTAGMNRQQLMWWEGWTAGREINQQAYQQIPAYKAAADAWRKANGKPSETYWQMQIRHRQEKRENLASSGLLPERVTGNEVQEYIGKGLADLEAGRRPNVTGYMRDRGCTERHVRAVQQRDTSKQNASALEQHAQHPVLKLIAEHGKVTDMHTGTVTRSLRKVGEQYTLAQRVAALEARLSALEHRHELEDAGMDLRAEAVRLHKQNALGYKAIAKRLGASPSSVRNWIKADAKL